MQSARMLVFLVEVFMLFNYGGAASLKEIRIQNANLGDPRNG